MVLLTFPKPTIVAVIPATVPVNVGEANDAFKFNADCVAVETGLFKSEVLSTSPKPTIAFVIPETVPVNVGEVKDAFALIRLLKLTVSILANLALIPFLKLMVSAILNFKSNAD